MDFLDFMSVGIEKKHCSGPEEAGFYINLSLSLYALNARFDIEERS